jgi:hypothetical protein
MAAPSVHFFPRVGICSCLERRALICVLDLHAGCNCRIETEANHTIEGIGGLFIPLPTKREHIENQVDAALLVGFEALVRAVQATISGAPFASAT